MIIRTYISIVTVIILCAFFSISRFYVDGNLITPYSLWKTAAHFYVASLVTINIQQIIKLWKDPVCITWADFCEEFPIFITLAWLIPSLIELWLFLEGPFNTFNL